jgi:integrase
MCRGICPFPQWRFDDYRGSIVTRCALQLAPLVFVRPGELRQAEWSEFDLETAEWRIPAEKMKASAVHIVPLSRQALDILREIHPLTGHGRYVFPSPRADSRPMSSNAILSALRRMGYAKDEMSGHGFRSMASTLLNERGEPGRHRAPTCPCRKKQRACGVQLCRVHAGTEEDDAGLGRLPGRDQVRGQNHTDTGYGVKKKTT